MAQRSLRTGSIYCLAIWAAIWVMFLLMRLSPVDIRVIPGIGQVLLAALATVFVAPLVATVLAGVALFREPRAPLTLLILGCAITVMVGQVYLFYVASWM